MDFTAINQRLADVFPQLSPRLQKAARYVLDRPDDVALLSMRGLAAKADVHPSTMVRLARSLDFSGYAAFREPFQQRLRVRPAGYLDRARKLQARGGDGEDAKLLQEVLSANLTNLNETFEVNDVEKFRDFAKTLAAARRIYIVGLRSVFPVAFFFHYACRMFRDDTILLDGRGGTFADDLRQLGKGDVILGISFDPYTQETVRAVEFAKDHGGEAAVLTDSPVSPLAKLGDHMLLIKNESPSFFHSIASAMAAVEALIVLMVAEGGRPALNTIRDSEGQLDGFDAYWHQKSKRQKPSGRRTKGTKK